MYTAQDGGTTLAPWFAMSDPFTRDRASLRAFGTYVPPAAAALLRVEAGTCHWPLGDLDSEAFRFCDAPRERGCYCVEHRRLALRRRP